MILDMEWEVHGIRSVFGTRKAVVIGSLDGFSWVIACFPITFRGYCAFQQQSAVHRNTMTENLLFVDCISGGELC